MWKEGLEGDEDNSEVLKYIVGRKRKKGVMVGMGKKER